MIKRPPFTTTRLDEDRAGDNRQIIRVSVNAEEMRALLALKSDLNIPHLGTAIKVGAFIGHNVLRSVFGKVVLDRLFKKKRMKPYDLESDNRFL